MGRAGILFSHVAKAAAKLVADGKNPTVDNVREALGSTGSKSTIAPMLKRWKAEHTEDIVEAELGVPVELLQAIKGVYDKLQAEVQQQLTIAHDAHQAALQAAADRTDQLIADNRALADTNRTLSAELKQAKDALARLQIEQQALSVTIATAQSDNAGLQQRLTDRATEITALNQQLTQSRVQFEHYQEATARQRSEERQATDKRIARLEQELVNAQQHAAAEQSMIGRQEMQLAAMTSESTRLQKAAHEAQEQANKVRSERDQLTYQLQESIAARLDLQAQLEAALRSHTEARMTLAGQEKETQLLTERLGHAEQKMEKQEQERVALLTERGALQALVAKRTEKKSDR